MINLPIKVIGSKGKELPFEAKLWDGKLEVRILDKKQAPAATKSCKSIFLRTVKYVVAGIAVSLYLYIVFYNIDKIISIYKNNFIFHLRHWLTFLLFLPPFASAQVAITEYHKISSFSSFIRETIYCMVSMISIAATTIMCENHIDDYLQNHTFQSLGNLLNASFSG